MLTLMIVDDEKTTRESLATYVDWHTAGIGSVRTARNGIEALALAGQAAPEILLTDVRMPKMDGLQLAEKLKALNPSCKVVFLSGYADKEYLKKAIHLQAVSYVEKPVDMDEVRDAVRMAVAAFEQEAAERREMDRMRAGNTAAQRAGREELIRRLLTGEPDIPPDSAADAAPAFQPGASFTVCAVRLTWSPSIGEKEKARLRTMLLSTCGEIPPFDPATSLFAFMETDVMAALVARRSWPSRARGARTFDTFLAGVQGVSGGAFDVSIGIGNNVRGLAALPVSYASARQSLGCAFYSESERAFFPGGRRRDAFAVRAEDLVGFRESLQDNDLDRAVRIVHQMETAARRQQPVDIDSVRDAFFSLYLASRARTPERTPGSETGHTWQEIQEKRALSELAGFVRQSIEDNAPVRTKAEGTVPDNPRDPALRPGELHRPPGSPSPPSRITAALSRTYVSSLYKAATGQNVNGVPHRLAHRKAKELLLDGRRKTHEVALSVGYRDANYFSALFKKRVGRSPSAYRESE